MRKKIFIVSELLILALGSYWYYSSKEIEPLIVIVGSIAMILLTLFIPQGEGNTVKKEGPDIRAQRISAAKDVTLKATQKGSSKVNIKDIESGGRVNINIDQE